MAAESQIPPPTAVAESQIPPFTSMDESQIPLSTPMAEPQIPPPTPMHGVMTPVASSFPDFQKEKQAPTQRRKRDLAQESRNFMRRAQATQPPKRYSAGTAKVTRKSDAERIMEMEKMARQQNLRNVNSQVAAGVQVVARVGSGVAPKEEQKMDRDKRMADLALQRLSNATGDSRKWSNKPVFDKVRMMASAGVYNVFNLVITGAGSSKANGTYEPAMACNNRAQWKKDKWCIYWRDLSKGRRQAGEWVIQGDDHTFKYRNAGKDKNEIVPPYDGWAKTKDANPPAPRLAYRERKEPKEI